MDEVTKKVRGMYERFPYPVRAPGSVSDVHPRLMLTYLEAPPLDRPVTMLDAGCGTGNAALGTALCNPQIGVMAVDFNRAALARVRQEAVSMQLSNLKVIEVDLMTLEGLPVPQSRFDFIFSSGVVHHLPDPLQGLKLLAGVLAPHGVLRIMVYNQFGRHGLYRFVEAMNLIEPDRDDLKLRLPLARRLMQSLKPGVAVTQSPWDDAPHIEDVEFVDRYLHPHDIGYTIDSFFELVEAAGLKFLRWHEPREWALESVCTDSELCRDLSELPPRQTYKVVEQIAHRIRLDAVLCHPGAKPRRLPLSPGQLLGSRLALSPQADIAYSERVTGPSLYYHSMSAAVRQAEARALSMTEFGLIKRIGVQAVPVEALLEPEGREETLSLLHGLVQEEILYLA